MQVRYRCDHLGEIAWCCLKWTLVDQHRHFKHASERDMGSCMDTSATDGVFVHGQYNECSISSVIQLASTLDL